MYTKATDSQLMTIIRSDKNCPTDLLSGVVEEALNRNLFDKMIMKLIHGLFKGINKGLNMDFEDFMQLGRIGVFKAIHKFEQGKCSFWTYSYIRAKSEITHELEKLSTQKRDYSNVVSLDTDVGEQTMLYFMKSDTDVERYVVNKLYAQAKLRILNDYQRKVVWNRLLGYKLNEIAEMLGKGTEKSISGTYKYALKKLRVAMV